MKLVVDMDRKEISIDKNFPLNKFITSINNLSFLFKDDADKWIVNIEEKETLREVKKQYHYYENNG